MATKTKSAVIRPLGDRILVKRTEAEEKTAGGIVLPESAKEKPKEGKVIALGDGKQLDNGSRQTMSVKAKGERSTFSLKKNDRVLFSAYAGTEVKFDGDEYLIMREEDVLAVIG